MRRAPAAALLLLMATACTPGEDGADGPETRRQGPGIAVELYFPGPDDRLHGEARSLPPELTTPVERLRALAQLWIEGPASDRVERPLPQVESIRVDLSPSGRLYLDLVPRSEAEPPQLGSTEEAGALYSLVDTFTLNVPQVREVVLLWNGVQPATLAGHLDTGVPLTPRTDLIAPRNRGE